LNNNTLKSIAIWVAIALLLMTIFNQFSGSSKTDTALVYSQFMQQVKEGRIAKVEIDNHRIKGTTSEGKKFNTYAPTDPG